MRKTIRKSLLILAILGHAAAQVSFPGAASSSASASASASAGGSASASATASHRHGGGEQIFFPREAPKKNIQCLTYENKPGSCRLLIQCATFFKEIAELSRSPCTISENQQGVCCPPTKRPTLDLGGLLKKQQKKNIQINLQMPEINHACQKGLIDLAVEEDFENRLFEQRIIAPPGSSAALHANLFQTTNDIIDKSKEAKKNVAASVNLVREFNLTPDEGGFGLPKFLVNETIIKDTCPPPPICDPSKYRTIDGSCNNVLHKDWGKTGTAFQRILFPDYEDGVNAPREFSKKFNPSGLFNPLPSPRDISSRVILSKEDNYHNLTLLIMQWGQFLDHDITHTPITKGAANSDIICCNQGHMRPPEARHPACMPITIPTNDKFFAQFNQHCMDFVRSMPAIRPDCNFGPREQMNQITAFIDASNVYGSSSTEAKELRLFEGGKLKESVNQPPSAQHLLPPNPQERGCNPIGTQFCFKAGDSRVNEQPQLAVMHTIWMRQHNKIATELSNINPGWNDEVLYQEARRIVGAQMQHITYNEYLPIVLGRTFMEKFGLVPLKSGFANNYRNDIDPTITNSFAAAAFRYGHTLISSFLESVDKFGQVSEAMRLSEHQFSPFMLYRKEAIDSLLRGISKQPSEKFDRAFSPELTNHLFAGRNQFGMDLVALNIQRGRDHGLPGYNKFREICQKPKATDFYDLRDVMDQDVIGQLRGLYESVDDIDLFIGGIAEKPIGGSLLGHTFLCIVGDQFARLRLGDRFYYENGGMESSFSEGQLEQIRQSSLARIMCDNSDGMEMMQPLAFVTAHLANMRASCKVGNLVPRMSLDPWKNEPVWVK